MIVFEVAVTNIAPNLPYLVAAQLGALDKILHTFQGSLVGLLVEDAGLWIFGALNEAFLNLLRKPFDELEPLIFGSGLLLGSGSLLATGVEEVFLHFIKGHQLCL